MSHYYYDHSKSNTIKTWFETKKGFKPIENFSDIADMLEKEKIVDGDIIFLHAEGRDRLLLVEKAKKYPNVEFVLMSRNVSTIKKEKTWPDNLHLCKYSADKLEQFDKVKRFFQELSSGNRLWDLLVPDSKSHLLLHIFLPLDIDMQALEILWNDEKARKACKHINYIREMLADAKNDPAFYKTKLLTCQREAMKLLEQMHEGENKDKLKTLLGIDYIEKLAPALSCIFRFLDLLDQDGYLGTDYQETDVETIVSYFKECCDDRYWKDINSFHDWYCAVAECLRSERV